MLAAIVIFRQDWHGTRHLPESPRQSSGGNLCGSYWFTGSQQQPFERCEFNTRLAIEYSQTTSSMLPQRGLTGPGRTAECRERTHGVLDRVPVYERVLKRSRSFRLPRRLPGHHHCPSGDGDDGNGVIDFPFEFTNPTCGFQPVHHRHLYIHQN